MIDEGSPDERPQGLKNFQNNCYMNAVIQCLRGCNLSNLRLKDNTNWFKHMIALIIKKQVDSKDLSDFLLEFFRPENQRLDFERHIFVPKMQADAQEFLIYILQNIEQKTTINFRRFFIIKIQETIEKSCKKHTIIHASEENMLNLKIKNSSAQKIINVNDLLKDFFKKEQISCNCESCKTTMAHKHSIITSTPQNLIVVLNIFKFENNISQKITSFIQLTNEINMSSYFENTGENTIQQFKLNGVCFHLGNDINSGHYTSE